MIRMFITGLGEKPAEDFRSAAVLVKQAYF
jgi:hypothetical protein